MRRRSWSGSATHARAHGLELVIFNGQQDGITLPPADQAALFRSARMWWRAPMVPA